MIRFIAQAMAILSVVAALDSQAEDAEAKDSQ